MNKNRNDAFLDLSHSAAGDSSVVVEFDMVSLQQESVMKQLTQGLVDTELVFYLNGMVHGQRVFEQDLLYSVQGKKIVKSIQQRTQVFSEQLYGEQYGHGRKMTKALISKLKNRKVHFLVKMINMAKGVALKAYIPELKDDSEFFNYYFNKIV